MIVRPKPPVAARPKPPVTTSSITTATASSEVPVRPVKSAPPVRPPVAAHAQRPAKPPAPPSPARTTEASAKAPKRAQKANQAPPARVETSVTVAPVMEPIETIDVAAEKDGQISRISMMAMPLDERLKLWKKLNRDISRASRFVTLLRPEELPKKMVKGHAPKNKPTIKGLNPMWCCYCGDWTIFAHFPYVDSDKCIGCGISTKDFYNRSANNLWKVDL